MEIKLINIRHIVKKRLLLMIMKTFIFLLCTTAFSFTTENMFSQEKVMINHDQLVTIDEVFKIIKQQTDYKFIYPKAMFKDTPKVQLKKGEILVSKLLEQSLVNNKLNFELTEGNTIIIKEKVLENENRIFLQQTIKGKVTDENGEPLPGVTVIINNNKRGTATDFAGNYSISINSGDKISFSYMGFATQEFTYSNQTELNVVLKESAAVLEEVTIVSTGYQTISKERVTGSFAKVDERDFKEQRLSSLDKILEGRIVGYQGGKIRGTTSMMGLTTPLYVIDGFPVENTKLTPNYDNEENLPNLNLEDIESITVLKDAAASSIYGARAANGVVVITTKKAKAGKTTISHSSNFTVIPYRNYTGNLTDSADIIDIEKGWAAGNPNLKTASSAAYAQSLLNNAAYTSLGMQTILNGYAGNISQTEMNNSLNGLGGQGYKYYDDVARYAKRDQYLTQHNISLGKATETNSFNASLTYKGNQFEDVYTDNKSVGVNLKNSTQVNSWLSIDLGTYFNYGKGNTQSYDAFSEEFKYQPYNQLVNNDGSNFTWTAASRYSDYTLQSLQYYGLYNMDMTPMDELGRNLTESKNFQNRTFAKFNVKFSKAFTYNAMFQYEYGVDRGSQLRDKNSYSVRSLVNGFVTIDNNNKAVYNLPYGNIIKETNQFSTAYNFRQQLNFAQIYNGKHDISAIAGMEIRHAKQEFDTNTRYGYDAQTLSFAPINQNNLLTTYGSVFWNYLGLGDFSGEKELQNRYVSLYSTGGYTYDKRYSVTGSVRLDRSNLWGTSNKYQNKPTWSTGAGWNIDKESFFESSWVNALKLRASYGIGGNIAKNAAPYTTAWYNSNTNVGGIQGGVQSRPNPELSWEKTTTTNIGLDFAFFQNRLNGTFDFYNKKGEDLLANNAGIPTEGWGYNTYGVNNGGMTNKGIEVSLRGTIVKTPSFSWDASVLYAHNKNKVDYVNIEAPWYEAQLIYPKYFPRVGKDFNSIYGYQWAGLSSTGLPQVYDASGTATTYNLGQLDAIRDYGSAVPIHSGSFHTSVVYKNFSLSALFIYELGHKVRNTFLPILTNTWSNITYGYIADIGIVNKNIENRWMQPGDEAFTNIPRVVYEYDPEFSNDSRTIYSYADVNIIDASNVRLSNISLSYQMPSAFIEKVKLQDVRFKFNVENVFTLAKSRDAKYLIGGFQSPNIVFGVNINL
jgi:TonB-linked SusC/RagA family outer membrane protein